MNSFLHFHSKPRKTPSESAIVKKMVVQAVMMQYLISLRL